MTRLPTPGGDDGTWGDILNAFLDISHETDGTLKANVVGSSQIQNNAVTNAQLDAPTQTSLSKADSAVQSVNGKSGSSITLAASDVSAVPSSQLGVNSGVAQLDSGGTLKASQVPGSVVSANQLWISVKNATYGVVGNGIADDSSTIQAAINAAPVGSTVFFPKATYRAAGLTLGSGVRLLLDGATLKLTDTATSDMITGTNVTDAWVEGGAIDLNVKSQVGIRFTSSTVGGVVRSGVRRTRVSNGASGSVASGGIVASSDAIGTHPCDVTVESCVVDGCAYGLDFKQCDQARAINNTCINANTDWGICDHGCTDILIEGNTCSNNATQGIITYVNGSVPTEGTAPPSVGARIRGNTCNNNGTNTGGNLGWGINISARSRAFSVVGNACRNNYQGGIAIDLAVTGSSVNQTADGIVSANVVDGFSGTNFTNGINTNYAHAVTITGNEINGAFLSGINVFGANISVSGNILRGCVKGVQVGCLPSDVSTPVRGNHIIGPNLYDSCTTNLNQSQAVRSDGVWFPTTNMGQDIYIGPRIMRTGGFFASPNPGLDTTLLTVDGTLYVEPWAFDNVFGITPSTLGIEVTSAGSAGSVIRLGMYADSGSGFPGQLMYDLGTIDGTSATFQTVAFAQTLLPGLYWICCVSQGAPATKPTVRARAGNNPLMPQFSGTGNQNSAAHSFTSIAGALPAAVASPSLVGTAPKILVGT